MRIFKSKVDIWLYLPFIYPIFLITINLIRGHYIGLLFLLLGLGIGLHTYRSTKYIIDDNILQVCSSILINKKIEIEKIRRIEKTKSFLSSPALSLDRIEIFYNKFDSIIISPREKKEFLEALLLKNPQIVVHV